MSKSSMRSWASLKEIWEPTMTPAAESALGSSEAMVMSKALVAGEAVAIQQAVQRADTCGRRETWGGVEGLQASLMSWRALVRTSRGPAKSRKSNLSCRAKSTSTGSLSATALVLEAILGNFGGGGWGGRGWLGFLCQRQGECGLGGKRRCVDDLKVVNWYVYREVERCG
jgi:hypothetical protein